MIRRPPRSTQSRSSAASDVYKRQAQNSVSLKQPLHVLTASSPTSRATTLTFAHANRMPVRSSIILTLFVLSSLQFFRTHPPPARCLTSPHLSTTRLHPHTSTTPIPPYQPVSTGLNPVGGTTVDDGNTEPHPVSSTTTSVSASVSPRSITTTITLPTIPDPPQDYRPRDRSSHDSHSAHSQSDDRTRHSSSRSDDQTDRYPPRRQYSRDRPYPSYYDRHNSPPRERSSTHQPHLRPSRFDHPTLPTSHRRHRDNFPPSINANLPRLHHLSARRKQLHDSPQLHIRILRRP